MYVLVIVKKYILLDSHYLLQVIPFAVTKAKSLHSQLPNL